jgi:hypothetical protein
VDGSSRSTTATSPTLSPPAGMGRTARRSGLSSKSVSTASTADSIPAVGEEDATGVSEPEVPEDALRFFARWWRLETYLRDLTYTELRSHDGVDFAGRLDPEVLGRAAQDRVNDYIPSADADDVLAYLEAAQLGRLITDRWELFKPVLLPERRWISRFEEVRSLRNRVSHCRRPHAGDLPRLELLLADLERGAQRFFGTYNDTGHRSAGRDPFAKAWLGRRHDHVDLVEHARRQYWTRVHIGLSRRPWAGDPDGRRVSGEAGYLWHVRLTMESRRISPRRLWDSLDGAPEVRERLVHLLFPNPYCVVGTFATIDDPDGSVEGARRLLEGVCEEAEWYEAPDLDAATDWTQWREEGRELPRKVQIETPLASFEPLRPRRVFGTAA